MPNEFHDAQGRFASHSSLKTRLDTLAKEGKLDGYAEELANLTQLEKNLNVPDADRYQAANHAVPSAAQFAAEKDFEDFTEELSDVDTYHWGGDAQKKADKLAQTVEGRALLRQGLAKAEEAVVAVNQKMNTTTAFSEWKDEQVRAKQLHANIYRQALIMQEDTANFDPERYTLAYDSGLNETTTETGAVKGGEETGSFGTLKDTVQRFDRLLHTRGGYDDTLGCEITRKNLDGTVTEEFLKITSEDLVLEMKWEKPEPVRSRYAPFVQF